MDSFWSASFGCGEDDSKHSTASRKGGRAPHVQLAAASELPMGTVALAAAAAAPAELRLH